jgi:hypothetical protein
MNAEGYKYEDDSDYCRSEEDCEKDDLEYYNKADVVCEKANAKSYVQSQS